MLFYGSLFPVCLFLSLSLSLSRSLSIVYMYKWYVTG